MPKLAMEAHQQAIDRVVDEAMARAGVVPEQLDAVAVTVGPGLSLCLRVRGAQGGAQAGLVGQGVAQAVGLCWRRAAGCARPRH